MPLSALIPIVVVAAIILIITLAIRARQARAIEVDHEKLYALQNDWHAPEELVTGSVPREVALAWQAKAMLLFAVALGVGLAMIAGYMYQNLTRVQERLQQLERDGVTTQGRMIRKWEVRGKSTSYYAIYRYEVGERVYDRRATLHSSDYRGLGPGSAVTVRYLPYEPSFSRLTIESTSAPVWVAFLIPLLFLPILLGWGYGIRAQQRLLEDGQAAPAMVTRVSPTKGGKVVRYQFLDGTNNAISGSSTMNRSTAPEPGSVVTILYDPNNSKRNALYPLRFVRLRGIAGMVGSQRFG